MLKSTKELIRIVEKRASEQNSWKEAEELLQRGADITAATSTGAMIHSVIAEEQRFRPIIPWKADHCQSLVDVLQKAASDRLATEVFAANGGDVKMMRRLLQLKASCYHSTVYGSLGVLGSLLTQDKVPIRVDVVQFLMESDANAKYSLTTVDDQQHTVLSLAKDNSQCPQAVIDYMQRYFNTILNQVPFVQPERDPNEIAMWIRRGADIEATDKNGNTVLLNAVLADNLKLTRVLVSAGSNTAHRNSDGANALHIAKNATPKNPPLITILEAQEVNSELKHLIETKNARLTTEDVFALLEKGANINATAANGDSLLHLLIASRGTPEMVTAFVNIFNADIAATNTKGYRPMESCILLDEEPFTYLPTIFQLPKMTADLFTNPRLSKTLLKFAIEQHRFGAARLIQEELNLRLRNCVTRTHTNEDNYQTMVTELDQLTANGAQIDHKYHDQEYRERTVLHYACESGAQRLVKYMIECLQADYTLQNQEGDCPIAIAADYGHLPIVEYLRGLRRSSVNVSNNDKQTPLHLATKKRHVLVVHFLVKWGASHRAQNRSKQTPLDMARTNVAKNKEEEMADQNLIHFLEQLICPPVDSSVQQSPNAIQPDYELDTCELVAPVLVNPIPSSTESTDGTLGKQSRGLFSGSPNNNLHEAAKIGSVWEAQKAIGEGADIRHRKANRTPHEAALACEKEFNRQLNSSMLNSANHLVLERMAVGCQQIVGMIQQIAEKKLAEAIEQSNASLVRAYHVSGAPLTADTLYRACRVSDNVEIVDYLLNESVDAYQAMMNDSSADAPYRMARKNNFSKLAVYIKYRLSLECTKAVKDNNLDMVKRLVSSGASVDMHDTNNLSEALRHENIDLIQFLCAHGAKMPLNWITANSVVLEPALSEDLQPEIVFCLNQCLINRRLRFAAASGDIDGVVQCQHLGADIDSANCHGATALSYAIHYGNYFSIVHALVSSGASLLHSNDDRPISLLDLAIKKNYQQIASYLSKELNIQFLSAILNNEPQTAEKLANLGVDFNYQDEQRRTALHYAVQYHGVDLVRWLCEWGSVPTLYDIHGDYPIIQATEKGNRRSIMH